MLSPLSFLHKEFGGKALKLTKGKAVVGGLYNSFHLLGSKHNVSSCMLGYNNRKRLNLFML